VIPIPTCWSTNGLGEIFADDSTAAGGAMTAGEVGELDDVRGRGSFKTLASSESVLAKNGLVRGGGVYFHGAEGLAVASAVVGRVLDG
jgi:hypothetical protein